MVMNVHLCMRRAKIKVLVPMAYFSDSCSTFPSAELFSSTTNFCPVLSFNFGKDTKDVFVSESLFLYFA